MIRVRFHYTEVARQVLNKNYKKQGRGHTSITVLANGKSESVTSFMRKCQVKLLDRAKLVETLLRVSAGQKLVSMV